MCCNCCSKYKYVFIAEVARDHWELTSCGVLSYINRYICPTYTASYPTILRGYDLGQKMIRDKLEKLCPKWTSTWNLEVKCRELGISFSNVNAKTIKIVIESMRQEKEKDITKEYDEKIKDYKESIKMYTKWLHEKVAERNRELLLLQSV